MLLETYILLGVTTADLRRRTHGRFTELIGNEDGATAAEYAVLIALVAAVIIAGATVLGSNVNSRLDGFGTDLGNL
jgi:Flp pilus assembly pilin Flp